MEDWKEKSIAEATRRERGLVFSLPFDRVQLF